MSRRSVFARNSISFFALIATTALVTGGVLLGVYGKRLEERSVSSLLPLGDFADAAQMIQARMQFEAFHRPADAKIPTRLEMAEMVGKNLKSAWQPPDLSAHGFMPILAGPVEMPDMQTGIALLYEREGEGDITTRFFALFILVDSGQFATFDEYGMTEPLMPARSILERDDHTNPNSGATLAFSNGDLVFIVRADDIATLNDIRGALGAP